jgi:hypothetical protein
MSVVFRMMSRKGRGTDIEGVFWPVGCKLFWLAFGVAIFRVGVTQCIYCRCGLCVELRWLLVGKERGVKMKLE